MERIPDRPEPDADAPEYPTGTEVPVDAPGVDSDAEGDDQQPGFEDDPPQAD